MGRKLRKKHDYLQCEKGNRVYQRQNKGLFSEPEVTQSILLWSCNSPLTMENRQEGTPFKMDKTPHVSEGTRCRLNRESVSELELKNNSETNSLV